MSPASTLVFRRLALPSLLLMSVIAGCADNTPFPIAPPMVIVDEQWGPLLLNLNVSTLDTDVRPRVGNFGDRPSLIGGCQISPALPQGLSFFSSGNSCALVGTPRGNTKELTEYTITASNVAGADSATVRFAIVKSAPVFVPVTAPLVYSGFLGFRNQTRETIDSCELEPGSPRLPDGLELKPGSSATAFDGSTVTDTSCVIEGGPAPNTATSTMTYRIVASNGVGDTVIEAEIEFFVLLPSPRLPEDYDPVFVVGERKTVTLANPSSAATSCSADEAGLPDGLTVAVDGMGGCVIDGTPTTATEGDFYLITANNGAGDGIVVVFIEVVDGN